MKAIILNTIREIYRNKVIIYGIFFIFIFFLFSILLGNLSVGNSQIVMRDFGFALLEIFGILFSIFVVVEIISKEIDGKTIYLLLSKPIDKKEIFLGKMLGSIISYSFIFFLQVLFFFLLLLFFSYNFDFLFFGVVFSIYITNILFLQLVLFFSTFLSKNLSLLSSLGLYVAGHIWYGVEYMFSLREGNFFSEIVGYIGYFLPPFGVLNLKDAIGQKEIILGYDILYFILYVFFYIFLLVFISILFFNKKKIDV